MIRAGLLVVLAASSVSGQSANLISAVQDLGLGPLSRPGPMLGGLLAQLNTIPEPAIIGHINSQRNPIRRAILNNQVSFRQPAKTTYETGGNSVAARYIYLSFEQRTTTVPDSGTTSSLESVLESMNIVAPRSCHVVLEPVF